MLAAWRGILGLRPVIDMSDSHTTMTTLVRYERRAARYVWAVAGIAYRALAPKVLARAARSLARQGACRDPSRRRMPGR